MIELAAAVGRKVGKKNGLLVVGLADGRSRVLR